MATKYVATTFFFSLVFMLPIHVHDTGNYGLPNPGNFTSDNTQTMQVYARSAPLLDMYAQNKAKGDDTAPTDLMIWMYVFFVYFFSGLALYFIVTETRRIIRIRQEYLGSQSTVTDRTIRLSGIPEELRSEELIKETIESLQIGKVESVLLCKDWRELDDLVAKRGSFLRKLEEAWTVHLGQSMHGGNRIVRLDASDRTTPQDGEDPHLLDSEGEDHSSRAERPKMRIWYGFLNLQSLKIDAIDYYEEKLRRLDEQIESSRTKTFKPTPLAFVTLDSTAAAVSDAFSKAFIMLIGYSKWLCKLQWILSQ